MWAVVMEIQTCGIDDHSRGGEITLTIVDHGNLAPDRLAVILEAEQPEHIARPGTARDDDRIGFELLQMPDLSFTGSVLRHHSHQRRVGHRLVSVPGLETYPIRLLVDRLDVNPVAKLRSHCSRAI